MSPRYMLEVEQTHVVQVSIDHEGTAAEAVAAYTKDRDIRVIHVYQLMDVPETRAQDPTP